MPEFPDVPHTIDWEQDSYPGEFNVWCSLCRASGGSARTAAEVNSWADGHECTPPEWDGDEPNLSGDDGPSTAHYRATMRDAGRGHLLA